MTDRDQLADRDAFLERVRLQLQARYRHLEVVPDERSWALRLTGPGVDRRLPLTGLHEAVLREPHRAATLIADLVRSAESGLSPAAAVQVPTARLIWCVRTTGYVAEHSRADELLTCVVGGDLVAFVAEQLPNSIMRGVPREECAGRDEERAVAGADSNTRRHFAPTLARIRGLDRVPRDGWRLSADPLFQGSVLVVPEILEAFADRAGGDVLLAAPDRGLVLAVPASAEGAAGFARRVTRTWRETLNPCSETVLRTDGRTLVVEAGPGPRRRPTPGLLRRLRGTG